MKKTASIFTVLMLSLTVFSCSKSDVIDTDTDEVTAHESNTETEPSAVTAAETYSFTLDNGLSFKLGDTYGNVADTLGEPQDILEAPNCIREGNDTVYTFTDYSIMTSPDGDGNFFLAEFTLISDAVAFENGITIGSTSDDVDNAFGTEYIENFGVRTYSFPGANLSVVFDGDAVSAITVSSVRE